MAPDVVVSVKCGYSMPSWFDFNSLDMENIDEDAASLHDSVGYLHSLVEREVRDGVEPERIMLAGFAQGGVVALVAALNSNYRLGGVLALSSWLPKNLFRHPDSVAAHAKEIPIWYHHGTDDSVVRQELGWDSYQRTRQLGLAAYFKLYQGLGHEYGSQEMVDVQNFLFRRISADATAPYQPEPPLSAMKPAAKGTARRRPVRAASELRRVTVGGVAAHFNAPWHYAVSTGAMKEGGVNLQWKDCPGGTERMTRLLDSGELDMAVLSTDGAVAEIAQGGAFRIVAPYVSSPLRYGVFVSGTARSLRRARDLEGLPFAISRRGSPSHLMTYLHTTQAGWNPRQWDRTRARLVEVGNLAGAREALRTGRASAFLWEVGAAKQLVESGELVMLGECTPPWPSFVVAARNEMLDAEEGAATVREVLRAMQSACRRFKRWPGRVNMLCQRYKLKTEDARARIEETDWSCENALADEVLDEVGFNLVAVGLLSTFPATEDMFVALGDSSQPSTSSPYDREPPVETQHKEPEREQNGKPPGVRFQEELSSRLGAEDDEDDSEPSSASKRKIKSRRATPHPGGVAMAGREAVNEPQTQLGDKARAREREKMSAGTGRGSRAAVDRGRESKEPSQSMPRSGQDSVRFLDEDEAEDGEALSEPSSAMKRKIRNRKCTPYPLVASGKDDDNAAEEEGEEEGENPLLEIRSNPRDVDDSSSESSDNSYEPDFKKTDEGTYEMTGATAHLVGDAVQDNAMRLAWVKHNHAHPDAMRTARVPSVGIDEDDQISAILERSALSTATKAQHPSAPPVHPDSRARMPRSPHETSVTLPLQPQRGFPLVGRASADAMTDGNSADKGFAAAPSNRLSGGPPPLDPEVPVQMEVEPPGSMAGKQCVAEREGVEFVTSSQDTQSSESSATRQKRAALSLRKLRDSAASIRKTAAKANRPAWEQSSPPSSIQPVSLFSEKKLSRDDREVSSLLHEAHHHSAGIRPSADQPSSISNGGDVGEATQQVQQQIVAASLSDSRSFDSATRDDRSIENHAAEFRHTLRKSVHKNFRSRGDGPVPTSLFGGTQPPAGMATALDSCPICLEEMGSHGAGGLHITTCAHKFHAACYAQFHRSAPMSHRDVCPVCRTSQMAAATRTHDADSLHGSSRSPAGSVRDDIETDRRATAAVPVRAVSPLHLHSSVDVGLTPGLNLSDRRELDFASSLVKPNPVLAHSPGLNTPWIPSSHLLDSRPLSGRVNVRPQPTAAPERTTAEQQREEQREGFGAATVLSALASGSDESAMAAAVDGFALPTRKRAQSAGASVQEAPRSDPEMEVEDEEEEQAVLATMDSAQLRRRIQSQSQPSSCQSPSHESEIPPPSRAEETPVEPPMAPQQATQRTSDHTGMPAMRDRVKRAQAGQGGASASPHDDDAIAHVATYSVQDIVDKEWGDVEAGRARALVEVETKSESGAVTRKRCRGVRDATKEVNVAGGAMKFLAGQHSWFGDATLRRGGISASGAESARLSGQWLFKDGSSGSFEATAHLHTTGQSSEPCVLVWGGPWLLDRCQVGSVGGVGVMSAEAAALMLRRCTIGGQSMRQRSSTAVSVGGTSRCLVEQCKVHYAGTDLGGGAGVRAMDSGKCSLERTTVQHCSYCVAVHGSSRVIVRTSTLIAARFSALYADGSSQAATLLLQKSSVVCRLWYTRDRVGRFEAKDSAMPDET